MSDEQAIQVLNDKIKKLQLELQTRNDQLDAKIDELSDAQNHANELDAKVEDLEKIRGILLAENSELKIKNAKYEEEIDSVKAELELLKSRKHYDCEIVEYVDDAQVFDAFLDNAEALKLNYPITEMANFYTALKSSKLTILEGISGTGKSKLVNLFGKTLGLDTNNRMKMIPVSPGWTDDMDILGFLDENRMEYKEASTGLVSFLKDAERHPDKPYLVCFDEMNLAKVEYYFAQFISVLENDISERVLTIYNPRQEKNVKNSQDYPSQIRLGNNLIFCGTINVDESTYRISDKVLDRACLIKLPAPKLKDIDITVPDDITITVIDASVADIDIKAELNDSEKLVLNELNEVLTNDFARFGIAYRVVNQIGRFLAALPSMKGSLSRNEALDRMIVQKILSKVRGTQDQIGTLVGKFDENNKYVPGTIDGCLNKSGVVSYKEVRKALEAKAKELKRYGYVG